MIRRHGSRPTIALWMLVAIADIALVVAAVGTLAVLLVVAATVLLGAGVAGVWMLQRRTAPPRRATDLRRRA
ncbi:hypothetical protein Adi01nite_38790 [Amorphoplanes digitatis]|nr:hypothetical protein GCM10020092_011320 [Actinoplanes digitatis]GID94467.1 hypothetical protein Adi01nite_38790 [Actinoplanes digitatis]